MRHVFWFLFMILMAGTAQAGRVTIADPGQRLPASFVQDAIRADWPFHLTVIANKWDSKLILDDRVRECVQAPMDLCVGIDIDHHFINAHFGTGLGIPQSEFSTVVASGSSYFKKGDYQSGIFEIAEVAKRASIKSLAAKTTSTIVVDHRTDHTGEAIFAGIMIFIAFLLGWTVYRARRTAKKINTDMDEFRAETDELRTRNIKEAMWEAKLDDNLAKDTTPKRSLPPVATSRTPYASVVPPIVASAPRRVEHHYHNNNNGNDLLTGVLLGEAMSRPAPVVIEAPAPAYHHHESYSPPSYDSGGSSSDSSSSSSSYDSGGSSSSYDSGSSSSCDSGGSSGDW